VWLVCTIVDYLPSRHKQASELQRWAAVNRRLRLAGLAIHSRTGLLPAGQNRVTPGGVAE